MHPNLYLTFKDKDGTIVGPICYSADLSSFGPKIEMGPRFRFGLLTTGWRKLQYKEIPKRLRIESGWDAGVSCAFLGLVVTKLKLAELEGVTLWYFGWGTACGYTHITNGKFKRNPWLYKSEWSPKRRFCLVWMALFSLFVWWLILSNFGSWKANIARYIHSIRQPTALVVEDRVVDRS